jgi:hypothetical protein
MHIYTDENKKVFVPSVTSIISFVKTQPEYDSLIKWSNSLGFYHKDYYETLNVYADFGTTVHEALSYIVTNREIPDTFEKKVTFSDIPKYEMTLANFYRFYAQTMPETIYSEKSILSEKLRYGGTVDWISKEDNKVILTDFKTSSSVKEYMKLQLSAYRKLIEDQTDIKIDMARIMLVSTKQFYIKTYTLEELDKYYEIFELYQKIFDIYNEKIDIDSSENSLIIV